MRLVKFADESGQIRRRAQMDIHISKYMMNLIRLLKMVMAAMESSTKTIVALIGKKTADIINNKKNIRIMYHLQKHYTDVFLYL